MRINILQMYRRKEVARNAAATVYVENRRKKLAKAD
jgi:hypothetical protein